jgi:hypothetical protein
MPAPCRSKVLLFVALLAHVFCVSPAAAAAASATAATAAAATTTATTTSATSCQYRVPDLLSALSAVAWTPYECACCEKLCGRRCAPNTQCQLRQKQCRFVALPAPPPYVAVAVCLLLASWVGCLAALSCLGYRDESEVVKLEMRLGRRLTRAERRDMVEYLALGLGLLFLVVSVWPFVLAVRAARRRARARARKSQEAQRALGHYLDKFTEGDFVFHVRGPQSVGDARQLVKEQRPAAPGWASQPSSTSTSLCSEEEFWAPAQDSVSDVARRGLARVRGGGGAQSDASVLPATCSSGSRGEMEPASDPEPSSPTRLLARVPQLPRPLPPQRKRTRPESVPALANARQVAPLAPAPPPDETRFVMQFLAFDEFEDVL